MPVYLVTYDLNDPGQRYEEILKNLRAYSDYKYIMKSTFLICTNETSEQIYERATKRGLDKNDYFFVAPVTKPAYGWLNKEVWTWLNDRLKNNS